MRDGRHTSRCPEQAQLVSDFDVTGAEQDELIPSIGATSQCGRIATTIISIEPVIVIRELCASNHHAASSLLCSVSLIRFCRLHRKQSRLLWLLCPLASLLAPIINLPRLHFGQSCDGTIAVVSFFSDARTITSRSQLTNYDLLSLILPTCAPLAPMSPSRKHAATLYGFARRFSP